MWLAGQPALCGYFLINAFPSSSIEEDPLLPGGGGAQGFPDLSWEKSLNICAKTSHRINIKLHI